MITKSNVNFDNIPADMMEIDNWILWKYETNEKTGKPNKIPKQPNKHNASTTNAATWSDFETVEETFNSSDYFDGIGFVFTDSNIVGIDIDNKDDELKEYLKNPYGDFENNSIAEFIRLTDSYAEISPSGNGIHIYMKGSKPEGNNKVDDYEMYDTRRFFTVTGNRISIHSNLTDNDDLGVLDYLHDKYFVVDLNKADSPKIDLDNAGNDLTDEEVIERASKYNEHFDSLFFKGDISHYDNDDSSADFALLSILMYWTNHDKEQMERIFRQSQLVRDKTDRKTNGTTYLKYSIDRLIERSDGKGYKNGITYRININDMPIEEQLRQAGREALQEAIAKWKSEGENGKEPTKLHYKTIANILRSHIPMAILDKGDDPKVAIYLRDKGIYTTDYTYIRRYIKIIDQLSTRNTAEEVIYDVRSNSFYEERTTSRYLIPCNNGIFNLETKELEPFTPDYYFTSKIATDYVDYSDEPVPTVEDWNVVEWLKSLANYDEEIELLLWQVINDSLNANHTRKKVLWLYSKKGSTGKGTYQEFISSIVGKENVAILKLPQFEQRFNIGQLEGKVCVIGDDVPANAYVEDSSTFQSVVTGDPVFVEHKHQNGYHSNFYTTVIQSSNGLPRIGGSSSGTNRRLLIVPFNNHFTGGGDNWKIREEYIHDTAVKQYVLYHAINMDFERFIEPKASRELLHDYEKMNNTVVSFIDTFEEVISEDSLDLQGVPYATLYELYKQLTKTNGNLPLSKDKFIEELKEHLSIEWEVSVMVYMSKNNYESNSLLIDRFYKMTNPDFNKMPYPLNERSRSKGIKLKF